MLHGPSRNVVGRPTQRKCSPTPSGIWQQPPRSTPRWRPAATLRERLGEDAEAPLEALKRAEAELLALDERSGSVAEALGDLQTALGRAQEAADQARGAVARHEGTLAARSERLPVLRRHDLLALVVPDRFPTEVDVVPLEPLPIGAVEFARWLNDRLDGSAPTPEQREQNVAALDRAQKKVIDELHHGYDAAFPTTTIS